MRATSSGTSLLPPLEKRVDERAGLTDHHVVALLEAPQHDHPASREASQPVRGILLGVGIGTAFWVLLATVLLMA